MYIKEYFNMFRQLAKAADIKVSRGFTDFLADRVIQATTKNTIVEAVERFASLLNSNISFCNNEDVEDFLLISSHPDGKSVLSWMRKHPKQTALIIMIKDDVTYNDTLKQIEIPNVSENIESAIVAKNFDIHIYANCLTPLAHGGDTKAGNATLFRRNSVKMPSGNIVELPFFAGNSLRGQMRDLLAMHYLEALGLLIEEKPTLQKWFQHTVFAGGSLDEKVAKTSKGSEKEVTKAFSKNLTDKLGKNGETRGQKIQEFRSMIPPLSLLGCALSTANRIIEGVINVCDLRPHCIEWGLGNTDVSSLFEWTFFTKREDDEEHEKDDNKSMICNTECLKVGTELSGGIDYRYMLTEMELSCLNLGLKKLKELGYLGAEGRRGMGKVEISYGNLSLDSSIYENFLKDKKQDILDYLDEIGALL